MTQLQLWARHFTPQWTPRRRQHLCPHNDLYRNAHSSLILTTKNWKQPKCPSTRIWKDQLWYTHWWNTIRQQKGSGVQLWDWISEQLHWVKAPLRCFFQLWDQHRLKSVTLTLRPWTWGAGALVHCWCKCRLPRKAIWHYLSKQQNSHPCARKFHF